MSHEMKGSSPQYRGYGSVQRLARQLRTQFKITLQTAIAELDVCGFADDSAGAWKGDALWAAFKRWQKQSNGPKNSEIGEKPDLYSS